MTALDWTTLALGAFVLYTYAGYPFLIAVLARLRPRAIARGDWTPTVSVVIAAYNEERRIERKLDSVLAQDYPAEQVEILVASDGSTDGTEAVVARVAARHPRVRCHRVEPRSGKPTALNRTVPLATGEVLVMMDGRQVVSPGAIRALVSCLADPTVGVVGGEYELVGEGGAGAYWKYERWIRNQEARFDSTLGLSGCLYALRRADWAPLPADVILDDMMVPLRIHLGRRRVAYEPGAVAYDETADIAREFGRKVRTLCGNFQLVRYLPALLGPKNRSFVQLWSHKLFRLLVPYALAGLLACSIVGALRGELVYRLLLAAQAACYGAALAGGLARRPGKLLGLCNTFVVLNWAAVVGLWRFLTARQRVTW